MQEVFAACRSTDKQYLLIRGANHYYAGQPELLAQASAATIRFVAERNLIDL